MDDDRRVYLKLLIEQADKYSLELTGYCLMSNHVHIIHIIANQQAGKTRDNHLYLDSRHAPTMIAARYH